MVEKFRLTPEEFNANTKAKEHDMGKEVSQENVPFEWRTLEQKFAQKIKDEPLIPSEEDLSEFTQAFCQRCRGATATARRRCCATARRLTWLRQLAATRTNIGENNLQ